MGGGATTLKLNAKCITTWLKNYSRSFFVADVRTYTPPHDITQLNNSIGTALTLTDGEIRYARVRDICNRNWYNYDPVCRLCEFLL